MNQQSEHLSSAQIEDYWVHTSGPGSDGDIEVEKHLAACPSCRSRVLEFQRRRLGLIATSRGISSPADAGLPEREAAGPDRQDSGASGLPLGLQDPSGDQRLDGGELRTSPTVKTATTPDCLSEEDLRKQAAGLFPAAVASQWMRHVAACNRCAMLLRTYVEDFSDDFSPEERALLGQIKSASPDWQRQAARKTLQTALETSTEEKAFSETHRPGKKNMQPGPTPSGWFPSWKWTVIPAAAACVGAILIFWSTRPPTPETVETLLAQAYTQQRTLEMRWPGAQWSAFSGTMGSDHASTPRPLMEAEEALSKLPVAELRQDKWTRAIAEKEIAAGNPGAAVTLLESATNSVAARIELRLDLAMAYFAQGKQTHDTQWYEKSRGELDKILQQDPGNSVALFNRALILEQFKETLNESEADWVNFLDIETDAGWRNEGKTHLKNVQELLGK
ncbi:MAG TPA: hypothetical protein VI636_20945 [Candidatus Angelobacter sp.]